VIAWERFMRESEHAAPSTVRRRLAALSSLFKHLVRHGEAARNPVAEIARPATWGGYRLNVEAIELWVEGEFRIHDRARWTRGFGRGPCGEAMNWSATRLQP